MRRGISLSSSAADERRDTIAVPIQGGKERRQVLTGRYCWNQGLPSDAGSGFWGGREYFVRSSTTRRPDKCRGDVFAISLTSLTGNG